MPTAPRGAAALILLGALLAQAPLSGTATAYQPHDPAGPSAAPSSAPSAGPSSEPSSAPPAEPSSEPTIAPEPDPTAPDDKWPAVAHSWSELATQVTQTSPDDQTLRVGAAEQATQVMRCFKLDEENYCLGLGFVDQVPTGAELSATATTPDVGATGDTGVEQDIATGDQSPAAFVAERAAMPKDQRVAAELEEMQTAWDGRDKARGLRLLGVGEPTRTTPPPPGPPTPLKPALPSSSYIMKGYQTSQEKGYWCGPATFQSIDWADDKQQDTQASWAKDLGSTSSGTAISAMVKQTNLKTKWDIAAGTYIVQNVGHWDTKKFFTVHQNHLGDAAPAPVIEHVQLLKRYFPYLAFNHSGHYQVGRGYDTKNGTIGIFEVFNEHRFNSRGNVTNGPKNIPASALFNATLANSFKNIGL
jgi:hypothetical protein